MTVRGAGRGLIAGLVLVLWTTTAWARPLPTGDTIVLLGARSFGHGTRVAELLDDMAASTDVFGASRFEVVTSSGTASYADALRGRGDLRAVIALVGDLSALEGIDPLAWPRTEISLTSRVVDTEALDADLARLRATVERHGAQLIVATAPLGMAGRIEVPELLALHAHLRRQGQVLDLAGRFTELEPAPLFANGIDVLDEFGHEELARALYVASLDTDALLLARDDAERAARAEARALQAVYRGALQDLPKLIDAALATPPASPRHAARQAALVSWRGGLDAAAHLWAAIEPGPEAVPGLAVGRNLSSEALVLGPDEAPSGDPVARRLLEVLETLALENPPRSQVERDEAASQALALAELLVDARPDRLDAWLALQVASAYSLPGRDVRGEARDTLAHFPRSAVSVRTVDAVFSRWPRAVDALPTLLVASRPYALLRPTGPLLEDARRREALGMRETAAAKFERGMAGGRFPQTWRTELERLSGP